ncbi:hypothetical protein GJ629_02770 [Halapricum sp. CBA1109]|uniref:hypothetical protein n=1 Tax=Halapricum sp. CBA1109 TaxID=2668068 RepID=UPI0012FB9298|nr:hypothetical protein [Halapricum sp. CBA1109]MUV88948.1 hypothetical protein [Halapricum sp. CBA1109]
MYEAVADLPLTVEDWTLSGRERDTTSGFVRATTTFVLRGAGETGRGEDVTYETEDHEILQREGVDLPTGETTFGEYSRRLDEFDLFPEPPEREVFRHYRRWAVESAALDLALRQAGRTLGDVIDRTYDPVRFVVSTRLGDPPTADRVDELLAYDPDIELKLDPTPAWDDDLIADVAARDRVRILDLKGQYEGTEVDQDADPSFYDRVVSAFPEAVIEDPDLTAETRPVFDGEEDRVSWDAPIESRQDIVDLPFEPSWCNIKPSRFGSVESLFGAVEYCEEHDIRMYGGGQFELGIGRDHIQALASLCYPETPNDVAPAGYNEPDLPAGLPSSPLAVEGGGDGITPVER